MDPRSALERFIDYVVRDRVYLRSYECTVEAQNDDGSVDLLPDSDVIRGTGLQSVPIYHGLPGVTVRVIPGARVLLQFVGGDPSKPYASLWRSGDIEEISFNGGQAPVARQGDAVAVYWPATLNFTGAIVGAPSGTITGVITVGTQSAGIIQSGASKVKS
jgi:hypothetical protein